jgi:hypothetical protein
LWLLRIVHLVAFFISGQKFQNFNKIICREMFQALEPFRKEVVVDEPNKDTVTAMSKFFSCHKKYQHNEPLKDLGILGMTVEKFWKDDDKYYNEFEYGKTLVRKQAHAKLLWSYEEVARVVLSCMSMRLAIYRRSCS